MFHRTASERPISWIGAMAKECQNASGQDAGQPSAEPQSADGIRPFEDVADGRDEAELDVERLIETDPSLIPTGPSLLQVESAVLEPHELDALLSGLDASLALAMAANVTTATAA